jgi:hypothetical protein
VTDGPVGTTVIYGRGKQALREYWPGEALSHNKRIITQRMKEFTQHFRLFRVLCHALYLGL